MTEGSLLLRLAPSLFVFLWSSGWLAAKYAMPYTEPLTFLALRSAIAVVILAAIVQYMRATWPSSRMGFVHGIVAGVLLNGLYLSGVWWSVMHGLPVSISGLIAALQPILTALLAPLLIGEEITERQWRGVLIGFGGILMVLSPALAAVPREQLGEVLVPLAVNITGMFSITFGTFYQKRFVTNGDLATITTLQSAGAFLATGVLALMLERLHIVWNLTTVLTMAWSVLFSSIAGMGLLMMLIRHGAVSRAATLIYLMPPLVALEAFILFGERLSLLQMLGMAVTAAGVAMAVKK